VRRLHTRFEQRLTATIQPKPSTAAASASALDPDLQDILERGGLAQFSDVFAREGVTSMYLANLLTKSKEEMEKIGLKIGQRLALVAALKQAPPFATTTQAEHDSITALSTVSDSSPASPLQIYNSSQ